MSKKKRPAALSPFDKIVLLTSVVYPLTALPQLIKIYTSHSAHDFAIYSWLLYFLLEAILLAYAIQKRLTPIIIQDSMWLLVYGSIIIGILLYG